MYIAKARTGHTFSAYYDKDKKGVVLLLGSKKRKKGKMRSHKSRVFDIREARDLQSALQVALDNATEAESETAQPAPVAEAGVTS